MSAEIILVHFIHSSVIILFSEVRKSEWSGSAAMVQDHWSGDDMLRSLGGQILSAPSVHH